MGTNASMPDKSHGSSSRPTSLSRHSHFFSVTDPDQLSREKKKKTSKFTTLRKKLTRTRRHSRSLDYGKAVRELTSTWSIRELNALVEEYESSVTLKELVIHADLSRPHANSFKEDLSALYDYKYCTDVDLLYRGACFPVHRAILSVRCPFFRKLFLHYPDFGAQVPVEIRTSGVDVHLFSSLLRYLYTGDFHIEESKLDNVNLLVQLSEEFGTLNSLEHDLKTLLVNAEYCDAVLVFASDSETPEALTPEYGAESASRTSNKNELRCNKAILAARSAFFRNLLLRRARAGEEFTERALQAPTRIVLDDTVIPRQYARVLLNAIYLDVVDLSCIVRNSASTCSLSEVQAMVAGKVHMTHTDEAMEIYQIGQFLDFPMLSQGCEDIIMESLNAENLINILEWSSQPHGSAWVHRQALHYLREEFVQISHSPVICDLSVDYLLEAICSDFLQASELDVLTAVLKWGEHQLMKRMEEREPNLLSHTAHSVSKKGIKKRDLNDVELREILAEVLPYVRTDHIIPANSEVLNNAIKRGLVSTPPSHMMCDEASINRVSAWIRGHNNGIFVKPRLFTPYCEEAKALLEEQISQVQENEVVRLRMVGMSTIPDTLYMVDDRPRSSLYPHYAASATSTVDIIAGTIPVPDQETLKAMLRREQELQRSKLAQRAYSLLCSDRRAISHQIRLRVVREFSLPDSTVEILQGLPRRSPQSHTQDRLSFSNSHRSTSLHNQPQRHQPSGMMHYVPRGEQKRSPVSPHTSSSHSFTPEEHLQNESSACSDSVLSDMMPDIAMATASINQITIQDSDLELDLGDGNSHMGTMYI